MFERNEMQRTKESDIMVLIPCAMVGGRKRECVSE